MLRPWRRRRGQPVLRPLPDSGLWPFAVAVTVAAAAQPVAADTVAAATVAATVAVATAAQPVAALA